MATLFRPSVKPLLRGVAWSANPVTFARACGFSPDPRQADVLRSRARQLMLLCTRQWGKSSVVALLALHEAIVRPPALVLVFARAQRQAGELLRKAKDSLAGLGPLAPKLESDSVLSIEFVTGSRIIALPSNEANVRAYSPQLMIFDEGARVPDELYFAGRPMLAATRGRLIALSSAWATQGWFYNEWTQGGPDWERITVTAPECPRLDAAWLAAERAAIGDRAYRREYLCEFGDVDESVFPFDLVMSAFSSDVKPLFPVVRP